MGGQNKQLDDVFHLVSRFTIIFPIIIVIIALFLKFSNTSQQKGFKEYGPSPTSSKSGSLLDKLNIPKQATISAKFNLTGPLVCSFSADKSVVNVYIKDRKIKLKKEEKNIVTYYLLNGDCGYIWKEGMYTGEKICGISQQVSIADGLLSAGFIDPGLFMGSLSKAFNLTETDNSKDILNEAMSTCKNDPVPVTIKFEVPRNILFKNKAAK